MDEFIDGQPIPNQWLAAKAKALGVPKKDLLVLACHTSLIRHAK
jgi:hypothetical protein